MLFTTALTALATFASFASATPSPLEASTSLEARSSSFSCPGGMSYCPWTKACACPAGQSYDSKAKCCSGKKVTGAWPKPEVDVYATVDIELGAYCAQTPYRICKYDAKHQYCQAGLNNVVFLASVEIDAEIDLLGIDVDIDVTADISVALKNVCAGLAGLYLESVTDAVALFNTNNYGYGVTSGGVIGGIVGGLLKTVACTLGLAKCNYDCVSYCTKGCGNYIDVVGTVGGLLEGLVGFCILDSVLLIVSSAGAVVSHAISGLLCIVGSLLESLLSTFDCGC